MGICHICYGKSPPRKRYCETCYLLCCKCGKQATLPNARYCAQCEAERRFFMHKRKSPEEQRIARVRSQVAYRVRKGVMDRQPCTKCGGLGEYAYFPPGEIEIEKVTFLCKEHHREVRPIGRPRLMKKSS